MSQQERDGDQPWVLAGGQAGDGTDEPIELVGDVEFFEEDVEEPTSPGDAVCAVRQFSKNRRGGGVRASAAPGRGQASRCVTVNSWIVGGWIRRAWQTPPAERPALGAKAATCATDCREGRVKDVACADARCAWKKPRGCARAANDRV